MAEYEVVIYKYGTSLYHIPNDNAKLRPNVEEIKRLKLKILNDKKLKKNNALYYLYEKNKSTKPLGNVLFASQKDFTDYCKLNNLKLGKDCFFEGLVSDSLYIGHR